MRAATFDEKVAAYGAAHRLEDAIAQAREAVEKVACAAMEFGDLERAIEGMEAVRRECLRVAAS